MYPEYPNLYQRARKAICMMCLPIITDRICNP